MGLSGDFAIISSDSAGPSRQRVFLIRKPIQGRVINIWLVLATVFGAVITVADGLTRGSDPELGILAPPPLEYAANHAAFLLAAVTLPFALAYAKTVRTSLSRGLFLWFTFCTTAYTKDFSYLRLPGAPLFVTDVVLVALLFSTYILLRPRNARHPLALNIFLTLFATAGLVAATRGFWGHGDPILVLRDSALVLYALFLLIGYQLFGSWLSIKRWAVWFLAGTSLSVLNGLAWFVVAPEQRRFVFPGIYVLVAFFIVLVMSSNRIIRPIVGWIFAGVFSVGLLLANARSLFVSFAIVCATFLLVPMLLRRKHRLLFMLVTLVVAAVLSYSLAALFFHQPVGRDFAIRVSDDFSSGVLHSGEDPYWQFRLLAWKEAWKRFEQYPPAGEGFGIPFTFEIWDNDARPHNTFLTVLYKMGLIGFLPLVVFLSYFFRQACVSLYKHRRARRVVFLQVGCATQVSFCLFGMANLMLESPYLACLFWVSMGVNLRMMRMLDLERWVRSLTNSSTTNEPDPESEPAR